MAATVYRRRRDGIVEIVGPSTRARDLAVAAGVALAVLGFCVALALALAFYLFIGVPLAFAGLVYLVARLVRYRRRRRVRLDLARMAPPAAAPVEPIRRVPVRTVQPPVIARGREVRVTARPPERDGAVVISIPGTAASRRE